MVFRDSFLGIKTPNRLGAFSELHACMWLLSKGYDVYRNVSHAGRADIIAVKEEEVIKIDVKTLKKNKKNNYNFHRTSYRANEEKNVKTLFVTEDGSCLFAEELDKQYEKSLSIGRTFFCVQCNKEVVRRSIIQKYCSKYCKNMHAKSGTKVLHSRSYGDYVVKRC